MTRYYLLLTLILSSLLLTSCAQKTTDEQMLETTNKILNTIKDHSEEKFADFIAVDLNVIGKNKEIVHSDFLKLQEYYNLYAGKNKLTPVIDQTPNEMGQKPVKITFNPVTTNPQQTDPEITLVLLFGPMNLFPLNKVSGYKIEYKRSAFANPPNLDAPPAIKH